MKTMSHSCGRKMEHQLRVAGGGGGGGAAGGGQRAGAGRGARWRLAELSADRVPILGLLVTNRGADQIAADGACRGADDGPGGRVPAGTTDERADPRSAERSESGSLIRVVGRAAANGDHRYAKTERNA